MEQHPQSISNISEATTHSLFSQLPGDKRYRAVHYCNHNQLVFTVSAFFSEPSDTKAASGLFLICMLSLEIGVLTHICRQRGFCENMIFIFIFWLGPFGDGR